MPKQNPYVHTAAKPLCDRREYSPTLGSLSPCECFLLSFTLTLMRVCAYDIVHVEVSRQLCGVLFLLSSALPFFLFDRGSLSVAQAGLVFALQTWLVSEVCLPLSPSAVLQAQLLPFVLT